MTIRLIFSDIDGTLLQSNHQISPKTKQAIQNCRDQGIPFILVSARMPSGILPLQEQLGIRAPLVCYGGALLLGAAEKEEPRPALSGFPFPAAIVPRLIHFISERFPSICVSLYSFDRWIVSNPEDQWIQQEQRIAGTAFERYPFDLIESRSLPLIHKILCMGTPESINRLQSSLEESAITANFHQSKATYLEITEKNATKSAALRKLCSYYNVDPSETLAFGDNFNDLDMLEAAGIGIAMANAPEPVQAAADRVTTSNDEDGIAKALEHIGLS
ncbi:MAG: Cof-type HAD-IIB family hydrolase [Sporolactobacillus sp.]